GPTMATLDIGTGLSIQGPRERLDRLPDVLVLAGAEIGTDAFFLGAAVVEDLPPLGLQALALRLELGGLVAARFFVGGLDDLLGARLGLLDDVGGLGASGLGAPGSV